MRSLTANRLEQFFTSRGILTQEQYAGAEAAAEAQGRNVIAVLREQGLITHEQGCLAHAYRYGWRYQPLEELQIPEEVRSLLEFQLARQLNVVPVSVDGDVLTVATVNPSDVNVSKQLQGETGLSIDLVYSHRNELTRAVGKFYSTAKEAERNGLQAAKDVAVERRAEIVVGDESGYVKTLNVIIEGALRAGASDIHLEPASRHLSVRYSIDGKLHAEPHQPSSLAPRLAGLIKTRARLASSELSNQDGSFSYEYEGASIDIRVAVLPTVWGESITLRLGGGEMRDLTEIGFEEDTLAAWRRAVAQPNGICLAVGPMGSGKTTLHYASLKMLIDGGRKIVSLENPVEMRIPEGISQVSISQNVTWDGGMETILRSAASVLFVGEINKDEIAHTAIAAANTGHMVLSTLHTNDAPGAVLRLREMGLRPSVLADSLRAVCAQRLPRRLCVCKVPAAPAADLVRDFRLEPEDLAGTEWFGPRPGGCRECNGIGYKGRLPIHELMAFPRHVRDLITDDVPNRQLAEAARANGMLTLQDDGLRKARKGLTSLEEVRSHILID